MTDIKSADPASGVCVAHDVDRATVAQQMVKLRLISEFINPIPCPLEKADAHFRAMQDVVKIHLLLSVIGANTYNVALITDSVGVQTRRIA